MKTFKTLLMLLAIICLTAACSKSDDDPAAPAKQVKSQGEPDYSNPGTGTYVYDFFVDHMVNIPVICDDIEVDYVSAGNYNLGVREHFTKGDAKFVYVLMKDITWTSDKTGEVFKSNGIERWRDRQGTDIFRMNLIGDQGHHYVYTIWADWDTWETIQLRSMKCKE